MIPITHAERVSDPCDAAAMFRALAVDQPSVFTSGWRATTPAQLDLLITAADPDHENTITFERGQLDAVALDALRELVMSGVGYIHIGTPSATLRVWRGRAWMHGRRSPPPTVAAILGSDRPLAIGTSTIHGVTIKNNPGALVPFDIATPHEAVAFELFRACADAQLHRGFVVGLTAGSHAHLARLLHAIHAEVTADLELELDDASRLMASFPDADIVWSCDDIDVTFPTGAISTDLLAPVSPAEEIAWHARIAAGLTRSRRR